MEYLSINSSPDKKTGFSFSASVHTIDVYLKFKSDVVEFSKPKITAY